MARSTADWPAIRLRYEAGLTAPAIEKELPKLPDGRPTVTRQAILKRARKEGWLQGSAALVARGSARVPQSGNAEPSELVRRWGPMLAMKLAGQGKCNVNVDGIEEALASYAEGGTHVMAAALAGVSVDTWDRWRKDSPELAEAIAKLHAFAARKSLRRIDAAGKRGDWKADEAMLKANPATREDWTGGARGGLTVGGIQINFGPGMPAEAMRTIDDDPSLAAEAGYGGALAKVEQRQGQTTPVALAGVPVQALGARDDE